MSDFEQICAQLAGISSSFDDSGAYGDCSVSGIAADDTGENGAAVNRVMGLQSQSLHIDPVIQNRLEQQRQQQEKEQGDSSTPLLVGADSSAHTYSYGSYEFHLGHGGSIPLAESITLESSRDMRASTNAGFESHHMTEMISRSSPEDHIGMHTPGELVSNVGSIRTPAFSYSAHNDSLVDPSAVYSSAEAMTADTEAAAAGAAAEMAASGAQGFYFDDSAPGIDEELHPNVGMGEFGYWIFRGDTREFLFDEVCTHFFGLNVRDHWIGEDEVLACLNMRNIERFYRVMDTRDLGGIIFEDIEITKGPHAGERFVINGSVLIRFPDGKVRSATGYITRTESSFSEVIAREIAGDGFFSWNSETNHMKFSSSYCEQLGYSEEEFPRTFEEWGMLVHPDDRDIVDIERHILDSPEYGDSFEFCVRMRHHSGNYIWSIGRGIVVQRHENGAARNVIGTFSDINLVQDNFENIKQLLYTDTLTGLKNRSYFQHHMVRWEDEMVQPVSIIYADVTGLKITNDVLGHADGDILLLTVTEVLNTIIDRPCDLIRLAGDEFVAIITNCDEYECRELLKKLKHYVDTHNLIPDVMPVFVGFGGSTVGESGYLHDTLHAAIERADVRMQAYKESHRAANYTALKQYLEKRKGRPVSMRDGRRISYLTPDERVQVRQARE